MRQKRTWTEEYTVDGLSLQGTLREIIDEGKARRIIVKNAQGKTLFKTSLWLGAAVILSNPRVLLLGAMISRREPLTIVVEKAEERPEPLSDY
jgi:hypothetical protein